MSGRVQFNFSHSDCKWVLESLMREDDRIAKIITVSSNDDEIADYANDLAVLRGLIDQVKQQAVAEFGQGVLNFEREEI